MTNYEHIKSMSIEELAKFNIKIVQQEDIDYNWDEELVSWGNQSFYETSDGTLFEIEYHSFEEAVAYEIYWLKQEYKRKGE